jgi:hypothetical protein
MAALIERHQMCPLQDVLKIYSTLLETLDERRKPLPVPPA